MRSGSGRVSFNKNERIVLCVLLTGAGLLILLTTGGFMMLANALDGLGGAGNPSPESQERERQDSLFRTLVLIAFIAGGGVLVFLGVKIFPRADGRNLPRGEPPKDVK